MSSHRPKRLPALAALRAFDAVARLLSIQKAAIELGVTAAAVSQHVKALEADLGATLLRRLHRAVELTEAGQRLAPDLREGFARLSAGVALLRADERTSTLTVSAAPSLAAKWLVPLLDEFRAAHPGIELRLLAENAMCDFARDGVDVALRYGKGRYPGCVSREFLSAAVTPVCSPRLLGQSNALKNPADLLAFALLHDATSESGLGLPDWNDWFAAAGIADAVTGKGPRFGNAHLAVEAAIAGRGVALTVESFAIADIETNRLVRPFAMSVTGSAAYWVVSPETTASEPMVRRFREWILRQSQRRSKAGQHP
jgi:LysR family glycine cleavage system transcriptional activator